MKIFETSKLIGGWFVGDFEPTAYKTSEFEVCYKVHPKGEEWPEHYHKLSEEINYLIHGEMLVNGQKFTAPSLFVIEKNEIVKPEFLTDCEMIVVKTKSVPGDKYSPDGSGL